MVPVVMVASVPVPVVNSSTLVTGEEYLSMYSIMHWNDSLSNLIVESSKEICAIMRNEITYKRDL